MTPRLVVPDVATTPATRWASLSSTSATASPCIFMSSPTGTTMTSASITSAAASTDECEVDDATNAQRAGRSSPSFLAARPRAATMADKLPTVPPGTKTPPVVSGMPARSASHCNA